MDQTTTPSLNPYAAPAGRVADVVPGGAAQPLANRSTRLAATILNTMLFMLGFIPAAIILWPVDPTDWSFVALGYAFALPLGLINIYYLWRDGQSLGKKALGIRIARKDGSRASLGRIVLLRIVAPSVLGAIPFIGPFFAIANILFIFRSEKRCIHDYMADTIVIQAA